VEIEIFLLGRFEVHRGGKKLQEWPRAAPRRLLKLLALEPTRGLPSERIAALLWPDDEAERVHQRLHHLVYLLRSVLDSDRKRPSLVEVRDGIVRLAPADRIWIDVAEFERRLESVLPDDAEPALLEDALDLYKGPLLPDDLAEEWQRVPRLQIEQRFLGAAYKLAERFRARGMEEQAIATYKRLLKMTPTEERAHAELIEMFARADRFADAERQYAECKQTLAREIGVGPSARTRELYETLVLSARSTSTAPTSEARAIHTEGRFQPPVPLVDLVGRDVLVAEITQALRTSGTRLLTLTGVGGVGKTQLAIVAANQLAADYRHGACVISLGEVDNAGFLDRLLRGLDLSESPGSSPLSVVIAFLRERELLLVLDNFEHVLEQGVVVSQLLQQCPSIKVLCTSRVRLNLVAEHVMPVGTLDLDSPTIRTGSRAPSPAETLFFQRAQAVRPHFTIGPGSAAHIAAIVRLLDGLPLAIELAAWRVAMLEPAALRSALEHDLSIVAGGGPDRHPHQRSLEQSFEWSYQLLPPHARSVLSCVSVIPAPFDMDLADSVRDSSEHERTIDGIQSLVDAGLLSVVDGGAATDDVVRYRLHQTTRAFAQRKLEGETLQFTRTRFANFMATLAVELDRHIRSVDAERIVAAFERNYDNFFAALNFADEANEKETVCRLVRGLGRYWGLYRGGSLADYWVKRAIAWSDGIDLELSGWLHFAVGCYWGYRAATKSAYPLCQKALQIGEITRSGRLITSASMTVAAATRNRSEAAQVLEKWLPTIKAEGDYQSLCVAVCNLASAYLDTGALYRARDAMLSVWAGIEQLRKQEQARPCILLASSQFKLGDRAQGLQLARRAVEQERMGRPRPTRLHGVLSDLAVLLCHAAAPADAEPLARELRLLADQSQIPQWTLLAERLEAQVDILIGEVRAGRDRLHALLESDAVPQDVGGEADIFVWYTWACLRPGIEDSGGARNGLSLAAQSMEGFPLDIPRLYEVAAAFFCSNSSIDIAAKALIASEAMRALSGFAVYPAEEEDLKRIRQMIDDALGEDWRRQLSGWQPPLNPTEAQQWLRQALSAVTPGRRPTARQSGSLDAA
jgi:predicted ATPase/DNA-binding SARP family transcriptional activator